MQIILGFYWDGIRNKNHLSKRGSPLIKALDCTSSDCCLVLWVRLYHRLTVFICFAISGFTIEGVYIIKQKNQTFGAHGSYGLAEENGIRHASVQEIFLTPGFRDDGFPSFCYSLD